MAKRHDAIEVFAAGDRGRQGRCNPGEPGVIIVRGDILQPIEADTRVLDTLADIDRLLDPPTLVDVAHQIHVGADRLTN